METHLMDQLLNILSAEVGLHEELRGWLKQESETMGSISGSSLLKLQSSKIKYTQKITRLESTRIDVVRQLATFWETGKEPLTLSVIINKTSEAYKQPLQSVFDRLKFLVKEIHHLAQQNGRLSQTRLEPVELSLKFLSSLRSRQQIYSEAGTIQSSKTTVSRLSV
ncbi:flagellar protein FlgN [Deltaproteobacteria bacterium TL4]